MWKTAKKVTLVSVEKLICFCQNQSDPFIPCCWELSECGGQEWNGRPANHKRCQLKITDDVSSENAELRVSPAIAREAWKGHMSTHHPGVLPLVTVWVHAKSLQSCLTLCDLMDCSPAGSSVHGLLQARIQSRLPFSPPGDPPDPGIEPRSPALQADSLLLSHQGSQLT